MTITSSGSIRMLKEFRDFAVKGNALDMAVGIIIGAAFGTIVTSLVNDLIMPPVGLLIGGVDFSNLFLVLKPGIDAAGPYASLQAAKDAGAVTLNVGLFLNHLLSFLIVSLSVFLLVRGVTRMRARIEEPKPAPAKPPAPPAPSAEERLLTEIRDLLRAR